ncbi:MAG TPA: flagellar biosynthesis protein FlhF [Steroidobacteraceae bacterium]|nr:flagellar biosynthesis protein FlhF [Steroidobacteraceae bacterium]
MKIKRYVAVNMRSALAQVRAEQGPDAVILSSRRVEEGIEVIAAVDYDEALFADATLKRMPVAPPEVADTPPRTSPEPRIVAAPLRTQATRDSAPLQAPSGIEWVKLTDLENPANLRPVRARASATPATPGTLAIPATLAMPVTPVMSAAPPVAPPAPAAPPSRSPARALDSGYVAMQRELKDLREMLQGELKHISWNDKRLREPLQARVLEQLTAMDIAPDIAMSLAALAPRRTNLKNESNIPLALLVSRLRVVDKLSPVNGGVIALVGPTGAGKTTTIAKLAARWSMQHGSQDLALVSTDRYRIGAREQLMTYARILGVPMHAANSGKELARILERLKDKKLVLIDTAGMGPKDVRLTEQLAALQLGASRARVLLALPAHGEAHALEEIVRSFVRASPAACILTKVDEAASLGAVISTTIRHNLRIAYLCNGQRVPEDLHAAHERRVWLVRAAAKLKEGAPQQRVDEGYFARNFGGAQAHA